MPGPSTLKRNRKSKLTENVTASRKIVKNVTKKTRQLQNDLISNTDRTADNEQFTYKTRPYTGPSHQKLSNFLEQNANIVTNTNENDYYQIIHNSFLLELMKQSICISCKSIWNGTMSVSKREGLFSLCFLL